jgi:hypothetical protein
MEWQKGCHYFTRFITHGVSWKWSVCEQPLQSTNHSIINFKALTTVYPCKKGNKGGESREMSVSVSI